MDSEPPFSVLPTVDIIHLHPEANGVLLTQSEGVLGVVIHDQKSRRHDLHHNGAWQLRKTR